MNIYKITTRPEWNPEPSYHAGYSILTVFKGTNTKYHNAITKIEEIETGLGFYEIEHHKLPMTMSY